MPSSDCRETVRPLFGVFPDTEDAARRTPGMASRCAAVRQDMDRRAISCHNLRFALQRSARAPRPRRGGAGARYGDHRPLALRELDRGRFGLSRVLAAGDDRPTRRSPTASCSRCRRWRPSARRSTTSSINTSEAQGQSSRTKPSASGPLFDFQLFDRALLYSPIHASCWRASSTGWTAPMFAKRLR